MSAALTPLQYVRPSAEPRVWSCYNDPNGRLRTDLSTDEIVRALAKEDGTLWVDIDTRVQAAVIPAAVPDVVQQPPAQVAEAQLGAPLPTPAVTVKIERKKTKVAKRPDRQRMAANPQGFQPFRSTWWPL